MVWPREARHSTHAHMGFLYYTVTSHAHAHLGCGQVWNRHACQASRQAVLYYKYVLIIIMIRKTLLKWFMVIVAFVMYVCEVHVYVVPTHWKNKYLHKTIICNKRNFYTWLMTRLQEYSSKTINAMFVKSYTNKLTLFKQHCNLKQTQLRYLTPVWLTNLFSFFVRSQPEQQPVACTATVLGPDDGQLCDNSTRTSGSVPGVETKAGRWCLSVVLKVANKIASHRNTELSCCVFFL